MKVISALTGVAAIRYLAEDILPPSRPPRPDLFALILQRYSFTAQNDFGLNQPAVFQGGRVQIGKEVLSFNELQIINSALIVNSSNTRDANVIMDDFLIFLSETFGYRTDQVMNKRRSYLSAIAVEFDGTLANILSLSSVLEGIIDSFCGDTRRLKKLSFGLPEKDNGLVSRPPQSPIEAIEGAEFFIERRIGAPQESNRFFCSAPLQTDAHIAALENLEAAVAPLGDVQSPKTTASPPPSARSRPAAPAS